MSPGDAAQDADARSAVNSVLRVVTFMDLRDNSGFPLALFVDRAVDFVRNANNGAVYDLYELLSVSSPQMVIHIKIPYVACFGTKRILLVFWGRCL